METSTEMIDSILHYLPKEGRILEPSAGTGKLVSALVYCGRGYTVDCIELNRANYYKIRALKAGINRLLAKPSGMIAQLAHADFLTIDPNPLYNGIAAVPPYKDGVDCQHIMHMYNFLAPGGVLVSYTLPIWTTGTFTFQKEFRKWLFNKDYQLRFYEDESYVNCPKALLIIKHP